MLFDWLRALCTIFEWLVNLKNYEWLGGMYYILYIPYGKITFGLWCVNVNILPNSTNPKKKNKPSLPCDFWCYLIKKIYHLRANGIRFNHEKASCGEITRKWRRIFSVVWLIEEIYDVRAIYDEVWRIVWIYF